MYENARVVQIQPGQMDIAMHLLRTGVVPILKMQAGFIHLGLLPDNTHNRLTIITLWQMEARARAAEAAHAYQQEMRNLEPLLDLPENAPDLANTRERIRNRVMLN